MRLSTKKHVPLALSALALALALWWGYTNLFVQAEQEEAEKFPAPSYLPETTAKPEAPTAKPDEPERGSPSAESRPPPAPPPPERVVPDVVPPAEEPEPDPPPPGPEPAADEESRGRPDDLRGTSGKSELLGGVARTNARATQEVEVPEGRAWIGTPWRWVRGTEAVVGAGAYPGLTMEAPRFSLGMERYFIDRFEVSNFRYWQYLDRAARITWRTEHADRATLEEIARQVIIDPPANLDYEIVARQIYESNRDVLLRVFRGLLVEDRDGVVDEEATWRRIRERTVPGGLRLTFYDRAPPGTWPSDRFHERDVDRPVRDLSVDEAIAFALYEGRHVPTEFEWEYAARGRHGLDYPWDPQGRGFPEHVNGGDPLPRGEEPRTVPVTHFGQGASWIGVFQLLGNVSEWTSSYLDVYPGGTREALAGAAPSGATPAVHVVVRGGSANDRERVPVRPAFRGWTRGDPAGGPRPNRRLPWTGFRTARYEEVARSRLPSMHFRARQTGRLDPAALEPRVYAGEQGRLEEPHFFDGAGDPSVRPGVKSFVGQPLRAIAVLSRRDRVFRVGTDHGIVRREDLLTYSSSRGPVLLGLFHTDLKLEDLWRAADDTGRFVQADCPPGTWFVAVVQSQLALLGTDRAGLYYLGHPGRAAPAAVLNVIDSISPTGRVTLRSYPAGGDVDVDLQVPLGLPGAAQQIANVRLRLKADPRETSAVKDWRAGRVR